MFSSSIWYFFGIGLLALAYGEALALAQSSQDSPKQQLTFRSLPFAIPLTLEGDPLERQITSIELRLPTLGLQPVEGSIVFDESEYSFNEFGDATVVHQKGGPPLTIRVTPSGGIQLRDDRFNPDMQLVHSQNPLTPSRLLIKTLKKDADGRELQSLRILPLTDIDHRLDDREPGLLRAPLELSTPHLRNEVIADSALPPGSYEISGELGGIVHLTHDLNSVQFSPLGDKTISTALGFFGHSFKLKKLLIDDPTKQNRIAWELVPDPGSPSREMNKEDSNNQPSYRLVTSPYAVGPHRLLIYKNGSVQNILPLNNDAWLKLKEQWRTGNWGPGPIR